MNVEDLINPEYLGYHIGRTAAIDHNLYVHDDLCYQANYRAGLNILRIGDPNLEEVGFFDIYPSSDAARFNGAWSVYPYFPSGNVVVSGIEQGLFVLRYQGATPPGPTPPGPTPPGPTPPGPTPTAPPTASDGPKKCFDSPIGWWDSGGEIYDCAWYSVGNRCTTDGNENDRLEKNANEACCVCGGGVQLTDPNPNCNDNPSDWHDLDGPFYDCDWYGHGKRCELYGDDDSYSNFGKTAKEACCACK